MHKPSFGHAGAAVPVCLLISILALHPAARADDDTSVSILYYESIQLVAVPENGKGNATLAMSDEPATLRFDAYGRRFELQPDETRAVAGMGFTQLSGRLVGLSGSWFRLLRDGDELSGIIADGVDTYLVEPHRRVAELLIETPAENAPPNVIFRLADMLIPQGLMACATPDEAVHVDGQSAFTKLSTELQAATGNAAISADPLLQIGVIADENFVSRHGTETESDIMAIFNTVQGIYANKVGIELEVTSVFSVTPDITNPFSATLVASDLLEELGNWRNANQANLGHTHLLTSKSLINDEGDSLAGISYLGVSGRSGACNPLTGASLSRDIRGLTALIVTHEIGHNLGAPHDGDPVGACASTPGMAFIMSPSISHATAADFSDCSVEQIDKLIAAASCLSTTAQTVPVSSGGGGGGGGGGALGWLSIIGLLVSMILRRRGRISY